MLDTKTLESIAGVYEFARMTEAEQDQHLKDLDIRNLEEEVKRIGSSIARQRKTIRELNKLGYATPDNERNLAYSLARQQELQAQIEELRS